MNTCEILILYCFGSFFWGGIFSGENSLPSGYLLHAKFSFSYCLGVFFLEGILSGEPSLSAGYLLNTKFSFSYCFGVFFWGYFQASPLYRLGIFY